MARRRHPSASSPLTQRRSRRGAGPSAPPPKLVEGLFARIKYKGEYHLLLASHLRPADGGAQPAVVVQASCAPAPTLLSCYLKAAACAVGSKQTRPAALLYWVHACLIIAC